MQICTISKIQPETKSCRGSQAGGVRLTSDAQLADENFWTMKIHNVNSMSIIPQADGDPCNQVFLADDDL